MIVELFLLRYLIFAVNERIMKNIRLLDLEKYKDTARYQFVEAGIYKDLSDPDDTSYRIPLSFELEAGEDTQYPIEDMLDKYYLYVAGFLSPEDSTNGLMDLELGGELNDILQVKTILGKRVYNREFVKDGVIYVELVIE